MNETRTAIVLGAGAERVIAWETGVLAGLLEAGWDSRRAAVIAGTSAGALVAARLALGCDPREDAERLARGSGVTAPVAGGAARVEEAMRVWLSSPELSIEERRRRLGRLALDASSMGEEDYVRAVAAQLPAGGWPAALRLAAVDAYSGARVLLDAESGVSVARGVAAARAVPGLRPAVAAGGHVLVDAALGTGTNADLLGADVDLAVVVTAAAPCARPGTLDGEFAAGLAAERRALERAGVSVAVARATAADRAAMGDDLFSVADARKAAAGGRARGRQVAADALLIGS